MKKIIFTLLIAASAAISLPLFANSEYAHEQREADRLYQNGDYDGAYKMYYSLARQGHGFSQYRISYMYLMGQGKKEDLIESVAWSVLAAQGKHDLLVDYMKTVAEIVPDEDHKKADKKITQYMLKWGAEEESSSAGGSPNGCTGTRLCNHSSSPRRVSIPSNVWVNSSNDNDQQLKTKVENLNELILEAIETGTLEAVNSDQG